MAKSPASAPITDEGLQYHLHTRKGDLNPYCLVVGHHLRAKMIAEEFFENARFIEGSDYRSYVSYTGTYKNVPVSVVTHLIGSPSLCTILPEARESGARMFIRVGTCGSLIKESKLGDMIVVNRALRLEGTSKNYARPDFPAVADKRVVKALTDAALQCYGGCWLGMEATTDDFREGQGRPSPDTGEVSEIARETHEYVLRQGADCYSMEASALFVWCATHWGGIPCGVINTVIGNRITNEWGAKGEKEASHVALEAICSLAKQNLIKA